MRRLRAGRAAVLVTALAAGMAGCGAGGDQGPASAPSDIVGGWVSDTLPALASPGRIARLDVRADSQALLSTEYIRRGTVFVSGIWQVNGREFTLQPVDLARRPTALPLVWRLEGGRLVPVRWNRDIYGESGIPLHRPAPQSDPADTAPTREVR